MHERCMAEAAERSLTTRFVGCVYQTNALAMQRSKRINLSHFAVGRDDLLLSAEDTFMPR